MGQSFSWWCVWVEHATHKLAGRALSNPGGEIGHVGPRGPAGGTRDLTAALQTCTLERFALSASEMVLVGRVRI